MSRLKFRTQLLAALLIIVFASVATLSVDQYFNRKIIEFTEDQRTALELKSKVESLLLEVHEVSSGLFMIAAGEGGFGRAAILEAEFALYELHGELQRAGWEAFSISGKDLQPCLELAEELAAEAKKTVAIAAELKDREVAAAAPSSPRLEAALHLSLARAKMLSSHADLYAAHISDTLQKDADALAARGRDLESTARLWTLGLELMALALALFLGLAISRSLSRRLTALSEAALHYGRGDFSRRAEVSGNDEISTLARSFNRMAQEVQTQTRLLMSKRYVENILDSMTNGLLVVDGDRTIERVNRATCELAGRDTGELLGTQLDELFWPGGEDADPGMVDEIMDGRAESMELALVSRDGHRVPVSLSSAIMDPDDGTPPKVVCVAEDITEREELIRHLVDAKRSAERADRAKSAFLANMSHELRTPLNGILGYAQILLRDRSLTEHQRDALATMHTSGEHLLTLLNDILDLSKIEAGRMELESTDFHLPHFIEGLADMFRVRAAQKGIQFLCEMVSEVPEAVRGDDKRLRQILINLLGNAIKFTDEGGVVLKVGMHYGKVRFQVEDTGMGIPEEQLQEIFAPFKQLAPRSDKVEGTGLGLAITRRLATMMGSELEVASEPGKGSVFWLDLELPPVDGVDTTAEQQAPPVIGYKGPRRAVLIADDKAENRAVLRNFLEPLGFDIDEAENGQEALDRATADPPDLLLMDLRMPVMDGLEATRRLRRVPELEHVVVIAISASAFDEHRAQSEEAGCTAFLTKPVRLSELLDRIGRHLDLEWEYEPAPPPEPVADEEPSMVAPPADLVAELYDLALRGDIGGLREGVARIEALGEAYRPFAAELQKMAKKYQVKQIRQLLEAHLPPSATGA